MKAKVISYTVISKSHVKATLDILRDDGSLLIRIEDRAFVSTADTIAGARSDIINSIRNMRDAHTSEQSSKLEDAFAAAVGVEVDLA